MNKDAKKAMGVLALITGLVILAPEESVIVLSALALKKKSGDEIKKAQEKSSESIKEKIATPISKPEEVGLIRTVGRKIILAKNNFIKWIY